MRQAGIDMDFFTIASVLKVIGATSAVEEGRQVHGLIVKSAYDSNIDIQNGLISIYSRIGFGKYDLIDNNCEDFGLYCKTSLMVRGGDNKHIIGTSDQGNRWFRASFRSFHMASGVVTLFITPYALDIGGVRDVADKLIIGTSDKWKGIFGTTFTFCFAVAGLTFIKLRHDYDIGVRSDVERVPVEEFIELLGRKRSQCMSPIKSETRQKKAYAPPLESQPSF
ncbi:pentatricopeptide repeat-containing protein [Tanacetum coccineum]